MAEKQIQLHKKDDVSEKWYPITRIDEVKFTGYRSDDSVHMPFTEDDTLKTACYKITNKFNDKQNTLVQGTNITLTNNQDGTVTISAQGGGGGSGTVDTGTTNQLAIYTDANKVAGCVNVTFSSNTLNVAGSVVATGNVTCLANSSDKRLKTDIEPFKGLNIIENLNFVKFKWNDTACGLNECYKSDDVNYGVIAQDSEGVIDGFVFDMAGGYKGVRYEKLIPIMAQAIKELKCEIEDLKQQLKK